MSCLAAMGQLQTNMPRTIKSMAWMLTVSRLVLLLLSQLQNLTTFAFSTVRDFGPKRIGIVP